MRVRRRTLEGVVKRVAAAPAVGRWRTGARSQGERFLFVGGPARSGTTLLQNMLDSHPLICGAPEFLHLRDIFKLRDKLRRSIGRGWIDEFCSNDDVDRLIGELIGGLLLPVLEKHGREILAEKTPANVHIFSDLMELFPKARFVFVVRDPRAVVASLLSVGRRARDHGWPVPSFTRGVPEAVWYVRECLAAGFAAARKEPHRVLTVTYVALVTSPETQTKRLCAFLEIPWDPLMLHPASVQHPGERAIVNDVWYDWESYHRDPVSTEIQKWRGVLSPARQMAVSRAFRGHKELEQMGYDFSLREMTLWWRAVAGAADAVITAGRPIRTAVEIVHRAWRRYFRKARCDPGTLSGFLQGDA